MPEWLSMNMVMAGMSPAMAILMRLPGEHVVVAKGLKHGMGTVRALGEGGHSLQAEGDWDKGAPSAASRRPAMVGMEGM